MKITHAEFVISAVKRDQMPTDGLPEIALAGRSNVGKSSLINKMIQRKNLARTSSVPGKTQTLNYYRINEQFYFVDLPGYGFAKVSKTQRAAWGKMIESYLLGREYLKLLLHVIDLRHPPTADDRMMFEWLNHFQIPFIIVATKADKVPKTHILRHVKTIRQDFGLSADIPLLTFSAETGLGRDELWSMIQQYVDLSQKFESPQDDPSQSPMGSLPPDLT